MVTERSLFAAFRVRDILDAYSLYSPDNSTSRTRNTKSKVT